MCTIILASRILDDAPLLFASNRDEQLDRPAGPPALLDDRRPRVLAPRDLQEGGTWLGVNDHGLLAAITNRFSGPRDAAKHSRGELVFYALRADEPAKAADMIAGLAADDYNPFHLLMASAEQAFVVWSDGQRMHRETLPPGVHVLTERSFDAAPTARESFLRERLEELERDGELLIESLAELLSVCRPGDLDVTCVRNEEMNYGTRSSTILKLGPERLLLHADGPPCETDYADRTEMLHRLFSQARMA